MTSFLAKAAAFAVMFLIGQPCLSAAAPRFETDVLPLLQAKCLRCHGDKSHKAELDLRTAVSILKGGESGPAIALGKPEESLVIKKIRSGAMPPRQRLVEVSVKPIEPAETELLARWIALGAPESAIEPDVATTAPDPLVSDKDRDFWA